MPFTMAHSVTARPLRRLSGGRLVLPALAVGAMAPDFEYLVHLSPTRTIGHTIPGLFVLCLPTALAVLWLWHRLAGPVLAPLLRPLTGGLTNGWTRPAPFWSPGHLALICLSIVIGSFSHFTWDAFTHEGGVVVNLWSGFSAKVGPGPLPVYKWLQYGSSVFGMALLGVWAHRAAQRPATPPARSEADAAAGSRARRAVTGAMVGGLLLIGAIGAIQGANHGDAYDTVKGGAVGALAGSTLSLLLSCAALRRRPAEMRGGQRHRLSLAAAQLGVTPENRRRRCGRWSRTRRNGGGDGAGDRSQRRGGVSGSSSCCSKTSPSSCSTKTTLTDRTMAESTSMEPPKSSPA